MDNIYKAQEYIREFLNKNLISDYEFEDWKETLVLSTNNNNKALLKKWDLFGKAFVPIFITPNIIADNDKWSPCLSLTYRWSVKDSEISVRLTLVKNELRFVEIKDMFDVNKHFGDELDLVKEFDKLYTAYLKAKLVQQPYVTSHH